jgi:formate/nitrite transporter FocA (FNT family)
MKHLRIAASGVLAGASIALGGTVFLMTESRVAGALLFAVGLFAVCTFGFSLFTGKVCYAPWQGSGSVLALPVIWLGNLVGAWLTALLESLTRIGPVLCERAQALCAAKLGDGLLSVFILGVLCNVLIYIAVEGYKSAPFELGRYLSLFFGVAVFILCGFEHCVANMYYISAAGAWSGRAAVFILVNTLGNTVGGLALPILRRAAEERETARE